MIKKLAGAVREYKKPAILSPIFITGEVILDCILPLITAGLINNIRTGCDMSLITRDGLLLVLFALLSLLCGSLAAIYSATASVGFAGNLRHDLFEKVQSFSFENIDKFSTPSLVSRLTTDVSNVQMAFMMIIRIAIRSPLMLIFSVCSAIIVGKRLAWIFVGIIPVLFGGLFIISKLAMPIFQSVFKRYDDMNASIQENVKAMRVVKSFVREDYEIRKFEGTSDSIRGDFTKAESILAFMNPLMQLCIYCSTILISFFAAKWIVQSNATYFDIGSLTAMLTYSMQVLMSLMMLSMIMVMLTMSQASAKRIVEVLDEESTVKNPENPVMEVKDGSITFDNVSFKYSQAAEKMALSNIDFKIVSGQTVGIIGGTGTGKSSLIQLISRIYDVTEGSVQVGGVDVRDYDLDVLRKQVAVVLQKNVLFSGTIRDNLLWGNPDADDEELIRVCKLAQADEFIQSFPDKYDTVIEQGGNNVSGGQKQRLCIARALLRKPKILILDDSTSAVDTKTDALIRQAFKYEIPDTTKIIIAQRISSVQDSDLILVMENGRIDGMGTHEELLETNDIYREVYFSQIKGGDFDE
ncbi:MAG: ABC transporter ATP-binding protein [Clostridiales bacterium]|nr:ABC transporter ATP-binding protein [Clostridiales bacterium]